MLQFISWYFVLAVIGLMFFPIIYRLFPYLADRGYIFTKIAGLLVWSYLYWILNIFGIISNNIFGIISCLFLLMIISIQFLRSGKWNPLLQWIRENKKIVIVAEIIFFLSFLGWTIIRAANPDIIGTEKPMELAFLNSILRSPTFPPADPWLSGFSISYYYFGYVMVAIITKLTNVPAAIGFNLAISSWFALTALGCYGVVYNLLFIWQKRKISSYRKVKKTKHRFLVPSLLGPFFVLITSNAEGFLEMLHSRGFFWKDDSNGRLISNIWKWINIQELDQPPVKPFSWIPERIGGVWWWRASRIIQDYDINGNFKEVINEFPFFTYLLGDLHPHLLAMPFGLLAIGLSLNIFSGGLQGKYSVFSIKKCLLNPLFWFAVLVFGGIAFLNTWDFPVFFGCFLFIVALNRIIQSGFHKKLLLELFKTGLVVGFLSFIAYLPFFLSFSSQAGGILPSLNFFTRGINFWIMFFPFLMIIIFVMAWLGKRIINKNGLINALVLCLSLILLLSLFSFSLAIIIGRADAIFIWVQKVFEIENLNLSNNISSLVSSFNGIHGSVNIFETIKTSLQNRLNSPFTIVTLFTIFCFSFGILISITIKNLKIPSTDDDIGYLPIIILIILGAFLCLLPEFLYLKDVFGTRMNTIFKFYFQAWIIWGVAASAGVVILWDEVQKRFRFCLIAFVISIVLITTAYPFWSLQAKTNNFNPVEWTLDGNENLDRYNQDEYDAIQWLNDADYGVIAEAIGGSYSGFARVSSLTGLPTVLGWPGHEMQWRGGVEEIGSRENDTLLLYTTQNWEIAKQIIEEYNIRYIYLGELEKSKYVSVADHKFADNMRLVFSNSTVKIFEYYQHQ